MPNARENTAEASKNAVEEASIELLKNSATVASMPTLFCGVTRKVNTGNFENIDIYSGLSVPIALFPQLDLEEFKQAVAEAAELGFLIVSKETGQRYDMIKDLQKGG